MGTKVKNKITLYSDKTDVESHIIRFIMHAKDINFITKFNDEEENIEELSTLSNHCFWPSIEENGLILHQIQIMIDYLDDRFPHPALSPVEPGARAQNKIMAWEIYKDWMTKIKICSDPNESNINKSNAAKELKKSILSIEEIFDHKKYFMSDTFTYVDAIIGCIFWRLHVSGVKIPKSSKKIHEYMNRIFTMSNFEKSLSAEEEDFEDLSYILK